MFFQCVGSQEEGNALWNGIELAVKFPIPRKTCFLGCDILVFFLKRGRKEKERSC